MTVATRFSMFLTACLLLCTMQVRGSANFNWKAADEALQAAGMKANGAVQETKEAIQHFLIRSDQSNIRREIDNLRTLTLLQPFSVCENSNRAQLSNWLESIQKSDDGLSKALRDMATSIRREINNICMENLHIWLPGRHYDQHRSNLVELSSKFLVQGIDKSTTLRYTDIRHIFVSSIHSKQPLLTSKINEHLIKPMRLYHKIARQLMRALGILTFPMNRLQSSLARGIYAAYLIMEKLDKQFENDIRQFVESRPELEKRLLKKLEALVPYIVGDNDSRLNSRRIEALAKSEMTKPDLIKELGVSENETRRGVELALNNLLGRACATEDPETKAMLEIAGEDTSWNLPVKTSLEMVAAMCGWRFPKGKLGA